MSRITLMAKLTAADGQQDELEQVLATVAAAAEEEDGLEVYSAQRSSEPGVYYVFEMFRDEDAFAIHGKGEQMRAAVGQFAGLLADRPEVTKMTPVVAKGLDT